MSDNISTESLERQIEELRVKVRGFFQEGKRKQVYEEPPVNPAFDVQACSNCRFFYGDEKRCHRNPPTAFSLVGSDWPHVNAENWCGEHEPSAEMQRYFDDWEDYKYTLQGKLLFLESQLLERNSNKG